MAFKSPGRIRIPQWSIVNRLLTAETVTFDQYGVEVDGSRVRTDLTGGIVYFTVRDDDGNIVIQKDSTDAAEIELKNQVVAATTGQATVHFVYADTAPLSSLPSAKYWFDAWVTLSDGTEEPIVDRGRFYVDESVTHSALGPAPGLPTYPAAQTPQHRSFKFTVPTTGDFWTVTIPSDGMVDAVYCIAGWISHLPDAESNVAILYDLEADRTTTDFVLRASGDLEAGTIVDIEIRDV
jgi:hypothetical protein